MTRKHALIVDDSSTAQYRLKRMLRPYDLDINAVDSGEAALRFLEVNTPDVIFMDHLMPGMDGFRALQIIKSHPETATIPVIMYTSQGGDVYTGQARALGALDVVSKDTISATDLTRVLRMIHIEPLADAPAQPAAPQAATHDTAPAPAIVERRRAPHPASLEQARALEMRLRKLELLQEDSQRTMTARLVREIHGLRQDLKKEIHGIELAARHEPPSPTLPPAPRSALLPRLAAAGALAALALGLVSLHLTLESLQQGQDALGKRVAAQLAQQVAARPQPIPAAVDAAPTTDNYLQDLVWAFNQGGALNYHPDSIDRRAVMRLNELLGRLATKGFKGVVEVRVAIGDFCLINPGQSQAQMPADGAKLGDCVLASKVYLPERTLEQYVREIGNLRTQLPPGVTLVITGRPGAEAYPEAALGTAARDWNTIAQRNTRFELSVTPAPRGETPAPQVQATLAGNG
ncbi:response regulator [Niveibacterium sp. 24ML]|uniref:response regulator n=1 Tax=Niveibacterium sp. 24ML TaxID=2985512 RepID=UPI00226D81C5|nr:response regulator [Niveibacterium sp. 24ML]MCX9156300.1 response regulator [Niveibacterium sp. 24ML]